MINEELIDFTDGIGYIEKNCGKSFPDKYQWVHSNDFPSKLSITVSAAQMNLCKMKLNGCIAIIWYENFEYKFATYLGAKAIMSSKDKLVVKQGSYLLQIDILEHKSVEIYAPDNGAMTRIIHEGVGCKARFRFSHKDDMLFDLESNNSSYEFIEPSQS